MNSNTLSGYRCWDKARIPAVINVEAVSVDRDTFLATHVPFGNLRWVSAGQTIDEAHFLNEWLEFQKEERHLFAVVQGAPGTGKSHLIRWLKERYANTGTNDVVLLIERSNGTLRETLRQILETAAFQGDEQQKRIEQLQRAHDSLSPKALEESLIDNLRIASDEIPLTPEEESGTAARIIKRLRPHLENFLRDPKINILLRAPGGPVERILKHLARTPEAGVAESEYIGFLADDFNFDPDTEVFRGISSDYGVQQFVLNLVDREASREQLAHFLNRRLEFAIGRIMAFSVNDLKAMFFQLRRELRAQGRGLALFVEDITAFTGLDRGLIDVLATQHTGEGDREYCRLMSVIGITDSYFNSQFPDNMKQRVTHQLSLNAPSEGEYRFVSNLLEDESQRLALTARYLNAMRLSPAQITEWVHGGADPTRLPNACTPCKHRTICHPAFGAVVDSDSKQVFGLYPFNSRAITTMYERLKGEEHKTPRGLLRHVLYHVLFRHSDLIPRRLFPPHAEEIGELFDAPLSRSLELNAKMKALAGDKEPQLNSLIRLWGDGTLGEITAPDGTRWIGDIPEPVFQTFAIPVAAPTAKGTHLPPPQPKPAPRPIPPSPDITPGPSISPAVAQRTSEYETYYGYLNSWLTGTGYLEGYESIRKWLVDALADFIPWDSYGIARELVRERLTPRYFVFEGQAIRAINPILIPRDESSSGYFLEALLQIRLNDNALTPAERVANLRRLRKGLKEYEPKTIELVTRYSDTDPVVRPLLPALLQHSAIIRWIRGRGGSKEHDPTILYRAVVERWWDGWANSAIEERKLYEEQGKWYEMVKAFDPHLRPNNNLLEKLHQGLLQTLNVAKGDGTSLFMNAANALDALTSWRDAEYALPERLDKKQGSIIWERLTDLNHTINRHCAAALDEARHTHAKRAEAIRTIIGDLDGKEAYRRIEESRNRLKMSNLDLPMDLRVSIEPVSLEPALKKADFLAKQTTPGDLWMGLSGNRKQWQALRDHSVYLKGVATFFRTTQQQKEQEIQTLREAMGSMIQPEVIDQQFEKIQARLTQAIRELS